MLTVLRLSTCKQRISREIILGVCKSWLVMVTIHKFSKHYNNNHRRKEYSKSTAVDKKK